MQLEDNIIFETALMLLDFIWSHQVYIGLQSGAMYNKLDSEMSLLSLAEQKTDTVRCY